MSGGTWLVTATCYYVPMTRKKISTTVYLTEDQVIALKELHHRTKVPIAEYIRMGIDQILERFADRLPGQVSLFDNGELKTMSRRPPSQSLHDPSPKE